MKMGLIEWGGQHPGHRDLMCGRATIFPCLWIGRIIAREDGPGLRLFRRASRCSVQVFSSSFSSGDVSDQDTRLSPTDAETS